MELQINDLAQSVIKKYERLAGERVNWTSHWDEIAKYIVPRKDDVYGQLTPGQKVHNHLFDNESIKANDDLAAALHGLLTSPNDIWFGLGTGDNVLDLNDSVNKWLARSSERMIEVINDSNFQTEIHEVYTDLPSIGTTTLRVEEDDDDIVRFYTQTIYDVQVEENNKGDIDTVLRKWCWGPRQIIQEYEKTMKLKDIKDLEKAGDKKFDIIHEVSPRPRSMMKRGKGSKAMPWRSIHVLKDTGLILRESGFEEFPYAVPRWTKINKEKFGRSCGMKVLSDIKMINSMKKVNIQGAQMRMAPPLQSPDNGFLGPLQVKPFGVNYYRAGSKDRIEPLFTGQDASFGLDYLEYIKTSIKEGFFIDKLRLIESDRMTATEVIQRRDEQFRLLGPILGRLHRELLKPIIDRVFGIMYRRDMFDPMPEELMNALERNGKVKLKIQYKSPIAMAQKSIKAENFVRAVSSSSQVIEMQPEVMDNIDGDKVLRNNMKTFGVNPEVLRTEKEVKAIREQRQAALDQQAQDQSAVAQSEAIKNVGDADAATRRGGQR